MAKPVEVELASLKSAAMNKARAMLDSLMGPGRDAAVKDKAKAKEKFKDPSVCKAFLVGCCPMGPGMLGGTRNYPMCSLNHSETMKSQFEVHPEHGQLLRDYEITCYKDLQWVVRECEAKVAAERARMRDDWGRRRPPLPARVIDHVSAMKRESSGLFRAAAELDDDQVKEKQEMIVRSQDIMKEAEALEVTETEKLKKTAITEECCDICGHCYHGDSGNAAHLGFKVHGLFKEVRDKLAELEPKYGKGAVKADGDAEKKTSRKEEDGGGSGGARGRGDARGDGRGEEGGEREDRSRNRGRRGEEQEKNSGGGDRNARGDRRDRSRSRRRGREEQDRGRRRSNSRGKGRGDRDDSRSRR